jgi:hypothetical protein
VRRCNLPCSNTSQSHSSGLNTSHLKGLKMVIKTSDGVYDEM